MINKFEIGDRVLVRGWFEYRGIENELCFSYSTDRNSENYHEKIQASISKIRTWSDGTMSYTIKPTEPQYKFSTLEIHKNDRLELDKQYYRELRLEKILNKKVEKSKKV